MLQYFKETSESHVGYFQMCCHILRHIRHLLALCLKSHKPPFLLAPLRYSSKKVTHNILVYRQVQIIVAVTCVLYISYVTEYKEYNFEGFW